jgi:cell division protein FtsL
MSEQIRFFSRNVCSVRRQRLQALKIALAVIAVLLLSYTYVWQRVYTLKLAEEYSVRLGRVGDLEDRCRTLQFEIADLASMQRLEKIATRKLGLQPLSDRQRMHYRSLLPGPENDDAETPPGRSGLIIADNKTSVDGGN